MNNKLDLSKLAKEIENKKSERGTTPNKSNPQMFLRSLAESLKTGRVNESVDTIKRVTNEATEKANIKFNKNEKKPYSDVGSIPNNQQRRPIINEEIDQDRTENLHRFFEQQNKKTLADELEARMRQEHPQHQNKGNLYEDQRGKSRGGGINEQYLNDKIDSRMTNFLLENTTQIFTETMKSLLLEQFSKDKIKEVLLENRGLIREAVIDIIKEIQKKKKAQA